MSNENEYQNYEFCKNVKCAEFDTEKQLCSMPFGCIKTAKELHKWLDMNLFKIVKIKAFRKEICKKNSIKEQEEGNSILMDIEEKLSSLKVYQDDTNDKQFKTMRIVTTVGVVTLIGRYRRDLEKPNWHYYETNKGDILHFRKEHIVAVLEDENESFTTFES